MKKIQVLLLFALFGQVLMTSEVNIYTSRHYDSDDALYKEFTNETGIKINIISGNGSALVERIKSEGKNSPADIFFTVDAGNLWKVQKEGLFQSINSQPVIFVRGSFRAIAIPADTRPKYVTIEPIPSNHICPIIITANPKDV